MTGQAANPAHLGWSAVEGHAPPGTARLTTLRYDYGFSSLGRRRRERQLKGPGEGQGLFNRQESA